MNETSEVLAVGSDVALIIFPILVGLLAWLGKRLYDKVDSLDRKLSDVDKTTAVMSVRVEHIGTDLEKVNTKIDGLEKKVDGKP